MLRSLPMLCLLACAGCSDQGFTRFDFVDVWRQNPPDEVDILLLVDDSCSMAPYQATLGSNFQQFISWFVEANVDYRIGVVTTDIETPSKSGRIQGEIITPETPNAEAVFSRIVNVGISGSGFETGLEAARLALSDPLISTHNAGFLRPEASLSIIFVSDEQDGSPDPVNRYINDFVEIKGARNRDVFNASALVVSDFAECNETQRQQSTIGTRYIDVANQTGGIVGNLCSADFETIVFELSLASSRLRNTYFLSQEPNLATLQVSVDDEILPCQSGRYAFERILDAQTGEQRPAITFAPDRMPEVGSRISARYFPGGADPADFCREAR
jgi:hypothetical protein